MVEKNTVTKNTNARKRNCLVAQSGGPSVAINASLAGVIKACLKSDEIDTIYGGKNGIAGILQENLVALNDIFLLEGNLEKLGKTPSMYLGSCRYKMKSLSEDTSDYDKLLEIFEKYEIGYFFYIGGNDSMDTVYKLSLYTKQKGLDVIVMGVPKTIDNDLTCIDHTPGFGSAAKYIATSVLEMAHDTYIYDMETVLIVEIMGRNAGWLTAASALARTPYSQAPHLIYLPEVPFSKEAFVQDVKEALKKQKYVVVAVSEGIKDQNGVYISAQGEKKDQFGHVMLSGTGEYLKSVVSQEIGCKVRSVELNVLQRAASHWASKTDLEESEKLGENAVELALKGVTGEMSILTRTSDAPYQVEYASADIAKIANAEKKVPMEFIQEGKADVTEQMLTYLRPLIQGNIDVFMKDGMPDYLFLE